MSTTHQANFLEGIAEMDSPIVVDPLTENNAIHVPLETFTPDVLINNTTYDIGVQNHEDGTKLVNLDKYQTLATRITEDQALGASYDKIDSATKGHIKAINRNKYKKAIHGLAPASHTAKTPVIKVPLDATAEQVYKAILVLKGAFDEMEVPEEDRRLNLASDHANALLSSEKYAGSILADKQTGKISGYLATFKIYGYVGGPYYSPTGTKLPFNSVPGANDKKGSVAFYVDNVGIKTGILKQYYDKPTTTGQAHLLNYRHYFIVLPIRQEAMGAIYSGA